MMTTEERFAALEAEVDRLRSVDAVRGLRSSYSRFAMGGDWPSLVKLFTRDGVFDITRPSGENIQWKGHEEILGNLETLNVPVMPMIANGLVDFDGDHGVGSCSMMTPLSPDPKATHGFFGTYHDEFRREDGEWRFGLRRFRLRGGAF